MHYFKNPTKEEIKIAADLINDNELVAFPTETVYGIGAKIDEKAIDKLYDLKGRDKKKPFTIHISDLEQVNIFVKNVPDEFYILAKKILPGPLTVVLKNKRKEFSYLSENDNLGFRFPSDEIAIDFIKKIKFPILATSANFSNQTSLVLAEDILNNFKDKISCILDGGESHLKRASTVIHLVDGNFEILREGSISKEEIFAVFSC